MRKIKRKVKNRNQQGERKFTKKTERKLAEKNATMSYKSERGSNMSSRTERSSHMSSRASVERSNDYIYGINPVKEAIRAERSINSILIASGSHNRQVHEIIELAKERKLPVKEVPASKLNLVSDTKNHQNVVAYVSPIEYYTLEQALKDDKHADFIVALDGITDVHNLGAIMRTLEAAGFKYIMIPERRSAQLNSTVSKTSAGAIEFVRTIRVSSLTNSIKELKNNGYWVVGADVSGKTDYTAVDYKGKTVLVIGSEDKGMSNAVLKQCDYTVKIPMNGRINSLNASVSASILIYEAVKQR